MKSFISLLIQFLFLVQLLGCFASVGDLQSIIEGGSLSAPANWEFKNNLNNSVSGQNKPTIIASSLPDELEGATADIYTDSSCSTKVGFGYIVNNAFEANNIVFPETESEVGLKKFYGKYRKGSSSSKNCSDLNLSYYYRINSTIFPATLTSHVTGSDDMTFILSRNAKAIFSMDLKTNIRQVVADAGVGSGTTLQELSSIAYDQENNSLYALDRSLKALVKIDLKTLHREVVSDSSTGTGDAIVSPYLLYVHSSTQKAFYMDMDMTYSLYSVDLQTGDRTLISRFGTIGSGDIIGYPESLYVNSTATKAYFSDWQAKELSVIDIATGDRSEVSGAGRGIGTAIDNPYGIIFNADETKAYQANRPFSANPFFLEIDIASGNRTLISSDSLGTGDIIEGIYSISISSDGSELLALDNIEKDLIAIDIATGNRTPAIDFSYGTGPRLSSSFYASRRIAVNPDSSIAYNFESYESILKVDLGSGNRSILASNSVGTGPSFRLVSGMAVSSDGNFIYATDGGDNITTAANSSILRIDTSTGNRTKISGESTGSGPDFFFPSSIVLTADNSKAYVSDEWQHALYSINLSTGARAIVSDDSTGAGTGPALNKPTQIALNAAETKAYVINSSSAALIEIDLSTGNRSLISSSSLGSGTNFNVPASLVLNEAEGKAYVGNTGIAYHGVIEVDLSTGNRTKLDLASEKNGSAILNVGYLSYGSSYDSLIVFDSTASRILKLNLEDNSRIMLSH